TSRIAVLEGKMWGWATVLVKREPFTPTEVDSLREFADRYDFPLVYDPLVPGSGIFDRVVRGGVEREDDMDLRPSTDDWPFFFLNIPWMRLLPALRAQPSPLTNPIAITWIIVMLLFFASPFLRTLLHQLLWMPSAVRLAVAAILVGLVGFAMGIPFPTGLARVAEHAKPLVPWGWGINGVASVVASL